MGSRYGGLKQLDPMGKNGEILLEYNLYDAIRAGFGKVVFVISRRFADEFTQNIINRFYKTQTENKIKVEVAFQDINDLPDGFMINPNRQKPWGTLHAVIAARVFIHEYFAVINADDFYGATAFKKLYDFFISTQTTHSNALQSCMVGYPIKNTLINHNTVNRGVCIEENGYLKKADESKIIWDEKDGRVYKISANEKKITLPDVSLCSMNCWGFPAETISLFNQYFADFIKINNQELTKECYLPEAVSYLISKNQLQCNLLSTPDSWFGVTYPEDKSYCIKQISKLTHEGVYPDKLWS